MKPRASVRLHDPLVRSVALTLLPSRPPCHRASQTFWVAFLTLARSSTGENWNGMMYNMAQQTDGCVVDPPYDTAHCAFVVYNESSSEDLLLNCEPIHGCGTPVTFPYWILFTMSVTFVVLNVFVAVILEAFADSTEEEDAKLTEEQWEMFCVVWCTKVEREEAIKDIQAAMKMRIEHLLPFFRELPRPMGFARDDGTTGLKDKQITDVISDMRIDTVWDPAGNHDGLWVEFGNVACAVAKRVMLAAQNGAMEGDELAHEFELAELIEEKQTGQSLDEHGAGTDNSKLNTAQYFAAVRIIDNIRQSLFRGRVRERIAANKATQ